MLSLVQSGNHLSSGGTDSALAYAQLGALNAMGKRGKMNEQQATRAAMDFESMFLSQMLNTMFGESVGDESFGDAETSEIYRSMMMDEYGKQIAKSGGIGIADYIKTELLKTQEV